MKDKFIKKVSTVLQILYVISILIKTILSILVLFGIENNINYLSDLNKIINSSGNLKLYFLLIMVIQISLDVFIVKILKNFKKNRLFVDENVKYIKLNGIMLIFIYLLKTFKYFDYKLSSCCNTEIKKIMIDFNTSNMQILFCGLAFLIGSILMKSVMNMKEENELTV